MMARLIIGSRSGDACLCQMSAVDSNIQPTGATSIPTERIALLDAFFGGRGQTWNLKDQNSWAKTVRGFAFVGHRLRDWEPARLKVCRHDKLQNPPPDPRHGIVLSGSSDSNPIYTDLSACTNVRLHDNSMAVLTTHTLSDSNFIKL